MAKEKMANDVIVRRRRSIAKKEKMENGVNIVIGKGLSIFSKGSLFLENQFFRTRKKI